MDKETAVEILKSTLVNFSPPIAGMKPISVKRVAEIADFIEQQEQYAELGRLVMEAIKNGRSFAPPICKYLPPKVSDEYCGEGCQWARFCAKRAELEGGKTNE